jgi:hypothetical protein
MKNRNKIEDEIDVIHIGTRSRGQPQRLEKKVKIYSQYYIRSFFLVLRW